MPANQLPTASVVICAYTEDRWAWLQQAIESVQAQTAAAHELIIVVDHNQPLQKRLLHHLTGAYVLENNGAKGLSGARNTGVLAATGEIIAFLDDDAVAGPEWLERQLELYDDPAVYAVGGRIEPLWETGRPAHFPQELDWIVGCSYRGLPRVAAQVRNVIGASMSFRRSVFEDAGLFDERMGRTTALHGCEETELCMRAAALRPGGRVVYEPASLASHHVPQSRGTLGYMLARSWGEGISKAQISALPGARRRLGPERRYVAEVLPRAIVRNLVSGQFDGLVSSGAIFSVLAATAAGYVVGRARHPLSAAHAARGNSGDMEVAL
ncbi:glycosyltransferase family 2 protein [Arthrobacter sp. SDTb3-6]|uniref:glycosyltransferase family 2 protein n=1 Tax=Arthrobacter sp. SDTb3-6 TaxID=2713571 RepID=UPI00159E3EF2|nr:glycosyltransferase family 2 protein [Arthrobacter sp. SDTb3-6]NVM99921.1 glycosyltransferase family 2 protein [Arthrobacter sp. SDTb3-6]